MAENTIQDDKYLITTSVYDGHWEMIKASGNALIYAITQLAAPVPEADFERTLEWSVNAAPADD